MRYRSIFILATLVGLSIVVSSCKTKKKSNPPAASPTDLTSGGETCGNALALFNVEGLPPASKSQLKVGGIYVEAPSVGNSEKIYISQAANAAVPDLYIYRGHKSTKTGKFAPDHQGVVRATCASNDPEDCFTGLTYSGLNIDSKIPSGTLKIEAWACIGSNSKRAQGQGYQEVAYGNTVYR